MNAPLTVLDASSVTREALALYRHERAWARIQLMRGCRIFYGKIQRRNRRVMPTLKKRKEWDFPLEEGPHELDLRYNDRGKQPRPLAYLSWRVSGCTTKQYAEGSKISWIWGSNWTSEDPPPKEYLNDGQIFGDDQITYCTQFIRLSALGRYYRDLRSKFIESLSLIADIPKARPVGYDGMQVWKAKKDPSAPYDALPLAVFPSTQWKARRPKSVEPTVVSVQDAKSLSDDDADF